MQYSSKWVHLLQIRLKLKTSLEPPTPATKQTQNPKSINKNSLTQKNLSSFWVDVLILPSKPAHWNQPTASKVASPMPSLRNSRLNLRDSLGDLRWVNKAWISRPTISWKGWPPRCVVPGKISINLPKLPLTHRPWREETTRANVTPAVQKLTWHLKIDTWKGRFLLATFGNHHFLGVHVSFQGLKPVVIRGKPLKLHRLIQSYLG